MNATTCIDVLRHGECEGGPIFRGHCDVALSPAGQSQMQRALAKAGPWQVVLTSPLARCRVFASGLAGPSTEVVVDERLREMSFGGWDGHLIEEIWRTDFTTISAWSRDPTSCTPPGGEPLAELAARLQAGLEDWQRRYRGQKLLLVTHGGVIRVLLSQLLGVPLANAGRWDVPYACLSRLAIYHHEAGDTLKLLAHNELGEVSGLA